MSTYFDEEELEAAGDPLRDRLEAIARRSAGVDLALDFHLGSMRESLDALVAASKKPARQPYAFRLAATATAPASGFVVLNLIGPPIGEVWHVRKIVVGGMTRTTVANGSADVIVSATDISAATSLAQLGLADEVDFTPTLPNKAFYDPRMVPVRYPERIFVCISGGTNGQVYVANVTVEALEDGVYLTVQDA